MLYLLWVKNKGFIGWVTKYRNPDDINYASPHHYRYALWTVKFCLFVSPLTYLLHQCTNSIICYTSLEVYVFLFKIDVNKVSNVFLFVSSNVLATHYNFLLLFIWQKIILGLQYLKRMYMYGGFHYMSFSQASYNSWFHVFLYQISKSRKFMKYGFSYRWTSIMNLWRR